MTTLSPFRYESLDLSQPSLRLIEILHINSSGTLVCKIRHVKATDKYIALSYMWGSDQPSHDITLIDYRTGLQGLFKVRSNLYSFLLRAASSEVGKLFWTDAICINQEDVPERNHQVRQMGSIYRNATEVRVWLGEDPATAAILSAMTTVAYKGHLRIADLFDEQLCPPEYRTILLPENRKSLLRNEYWSRTWIVQEIILAARVTVQSADGRTSWSSIAGLYAPQQDEQSPYMQRLLGHWRAGDNLEISDIPRQYPINFLLDSFGTTKCIDSRDHLYGLLALIIDGDKLEVDYTEPAPQLLVRATGVLRLDVNDLQPLLPALNLDAVALFSESSIQPADLWKTQKVLSQVPDVLDTKRTFPACSIIPTQQCEWSETGRGNPCNICSEANSRICEMPECRNDWRAEVYRLLKQEDPATNDFSTTYKSRFKDWLCSIWPNALAGPHSLEGDHHEQCYSCDIKKGIQDKRLEWAGLEMGLRASPTGHQLPSIERFAIEQSKPALRLRRAGRPLGLGTPPVEGPKLAAQHTTLWEGLFKGMARFEDASSSA